MLSHCIIVGLSAANPAEFAELMLFVQLIPNHYRPHLSKIQLSHIVLSHPLACSISFAIKRSLLRAA